jgi:hypothetical protein
VSRAARHLVDGVVILALLWRDGFSKKELTNCANVTSVVRASDGDKFSEDILKNTQGKYKDGDDKTRY